MKNLVFNIKDDKMFNTATNYCSSFDQNHMVYHAVFMPIFQTIFFKLCRKYSKV